MISFECDYLTGAHPAILKRLMETNLTAESGYGEDEFSLSAKQKIAALCGTAPEQVFLLAGGTQTNQLVISTMLTHYEGVIAATTGHVESHEAGAIEFTGHKVLTVEEHDGKIRPEDLEAYMKTFTSDGNKDHMVQPGMVYISHPTEYGTLYGLQELKALRRICDEYGLYLYLDGARLGYGLASPDADVTIRDIKDLTDVFYIGGTKCGALIGEALVFSKPENVPKYFFTSIKKHGDLLAKGRLVGIQFDVLFTDDLYFDICAHAMEMAVKLEKILKDKGLAIFRESPTNQKFVLLEDEVYEKLSKNVKMSFWEKPDENHTAVRLATCWSTTEEDLKALEALL